MPSTLANVSLVADVLLGNSPESATLQRIAGESSISKAGGRIQRVALDPPDVRAYPPALKAIFQAELILIGPGSLYTSILPNLLVPDLAQALQHARAPKVYICNLAQQPGETDNYDVADHVAAILQHIPSNFLDMVLANDNLALECDTVFVQLGTPEGVQLVTADFVDETHPWRHDSTKLAQECHEPSC